MEITLNDTVCKLESILSRALNEETVMIDIDKGHYYNLNDMGTIIWNMLDKPVTVQSVCAQIMDEYEVSEELCQDEVTAYLTRLQELDIIMKVKQEG